jgi:hypothetical protein
MKILVFLRKNQFKSLFRVKKNEVDLYCHHYFEVNKVKLHAIEFIDYAIIW